MTEPLDLKGLRREAKAGIAIYKPATVLALLDEIDGWKRNASECKDSRDLQVQIRKRVEAENKSLLDEIDRLKNSHGRCEFLLAENTALRSRIEELKKLGGRVASFGWGKAAPAELEVAILDLRRVLGLYD